MNMPQIQIRQTYALIGMDTEPAQVQMYQPAPIVNMTTQPSQLQIQPSRTDLYIDSSMANAALGVGPNLEWNQNIYSQVKQVVLQGILRRNEDGNRMMDFGNPKDPIPELAEKNSKLINSIDYSTPASTLNMKVEGQFQPARIEHSEPKLSIDVSISRPQIEYQRGKLEIYLRQRPALSITPPAIDSYK